MDRIVQGLTNTPNDHYHDDANPFPSITVGSPASGGIDLGLFFDARQHMR